MAKGRRRPAYVFQCIAGGPRQCICCASTSTCLVQAADLLESLGQWWARNCIPLCGFMRFLEYDRYGEATAQQEAAGHERSQGDAGDVRGFGLLHLHIGRTGLHRHRIGSVDHDAVSKFGQPLATAGHWRTVLQSVGVAAASVGNASELPTAFPMCRHCFIKQLWVSEPFTHKGTTTWT